MSIDLGDSPVGTPPTEGEKTQMRTALGIGASDTVEFGGFVPPSGTTAEIDAISDAVAGQVILNTDTKQMVRFLTASTYEAFSSAERVIVAGVSESSPIAPASFSNFSEVGDALVVWDDGLSASVETYNYNGTDWKDGFTTVTNNLIIPANTVLRFEDSSASSKAGFNFNNSASTKTELLSISLVGGISYVVEISMGVVDALGGNLKTELEFSGTIGSGSVLYKCVDSLSGLAVTSFNIPSLATSTLFYQSTTAALGADCPPISQVSYSVIITPTTSGLLTLSASQGNIDAANPLLVATPICTVTTTA